MAVNVTSGGGTGYAYLYASFFSGIYWPLSLLVWVRNGSTNKSMLKLHSNASGDYVAVSTDSNGKAQIDEVDMGWYNQSWVSNQDISADNVWRPILAVWEGPNLRRIYTPADPKGIGSTQALDSGEWVWSNVMLYVGGGPTSVTFEGDLAEVCMWNKVLDSGDYAQLLAGLIPSELYPNQIIDYWSMKDYYNLASLRGNSLQAVGDCSQATSHPPMRSGIKQLSASGEHDKVSIDYIGAGTITAVANSTYSWNLTNLPVGDGLLIELAFNGDATTYGVTSARLSIDGYPQNIPIAGYGGAFIAFPTISAEKQTLYVTVTNNDLASAAPYLFRVRGHDRSKMIGWEGSFNSAQSAYVDFERSGSAVVCAFYGGQTTISNGGTGSGGEWHPAHSQSTPAMYGQYTYWSLKNNGRGWYQQSLASFSWTGWHFVEIRVGEKPRRKRYIVQDDDSPLQPTRNYGFDHDRFVALGGRLAWTLLGDGSCSLVYKRNAIVNSYLPEYLSTRGQIRTTAAGRLSGNNDFITNLRSYYAPTVIDCDAAAKSKITFYSYACGKNIGSAGNSINLLSIDNGGGDYITISSYTDASANLGLYFSVANGYAASICYYVLPSDFAGVIACTFDANSWSLFANGAAITPTSTSGSTTQSGDYIDRMHSSLITLENYAAFPATAFNAIFIGVHSPGLIQSISRNPWQFMKPQRRRTIFTGTPVITHKRRRVL